MNSFAESVNEVIEEFKKQNPWYNRHGEKVAVLIPLKSKCVTKDGIKLDDVKIEYCKYPVLLKDKNGNETFRYDPCLDGNLICRITGKIQ